MKEHNNNEFWRYINGSIQEYKIDGIFRPKWATIQYLMEKYGMTNKDAIMYVNEIRP